MDSTFLEFALDDSIARLDEAIGLKSRKGLKSQSSKSAERYTGRTSLGAIKAKASQVLDKSLSVSQLVLESPEAVPVDHTQTSFVIHEVTASTVPLAGAPGTLTSTAVLLQDDPGTQAAQVLFSEFINILMSHPADNQIWEEVSEYERVCAEQASTIESILRKIPRHHANFYKTEKIYLQLKGERNTWRLLGSLYTERTTDQSEEDGLEMDYVHPPCTDRDIITRLYDHSSHLREMQIVLDWLERNACDDSDARYYDSVEYFGKSHQAWENTLRTLKNEKESKKRGGSGSMYGMGGMHPLVTSVDPDAPLREKRPLHDLDQEEDDRLVRAMFCFIRAGQIADAQELCAQTGHHWQAATLEGWKLYHDPNLMNYGQRMPVEGNAYRDMWKAVAWNASTDKRLSLYERAMYGALCGHLESLLEVCHNWEDQLWAYLKVGIDQAVEERLRSTSSHVRPLYPLPQEYPEEKLSPEGIFRCIEKHLVSANHGNVYYVLQKYLILDDIHGLTSTVHEWINEGPVAPHLLRCVTHLLLILKRLGKIPSEVYDLHTGILHACVKEAIERGDAEQVAWYSFVLPPWLQVRCYANFLTNICDDSHRRHALQLASLVGLDTCSITASVVASLRLSPGPEISGGELVSETTAEDRVKISGLDWLLYERSHRPEALRQGNAMLRSFLLSRKIGAARILFQKVPSDSVDVIMKLYGLSGDTLELPCHVENRIREYLCFRTFLDAQEAFTDWFDHYHQKKPHEPKKPEPSCSYSEQLSYEHSLVKFQGEYERWKQTLEAVTKRATERLYNVLLFPDGGWLVDVSAVQSSTDTMEDMEEDHKEESHHLRSNDIGPEDAEFLQFLDPEIAARESSRAHQLITLRSIYIPQVTSLLQNILHCTHQYKECSRLADLIASEQYQLYKCFGIGELQRFLLKLQEMATELLDKNMDALGYPHA